MTQPVGGGATDGARTHLLGDANEQQGDSLRTRVKRCYKFSKVCFLGTWALSTTAFFATLGVCNDISFDECTDKYKYLPLSYVVSFTSTCIIGVKVFGERAYNCSIDRYCDRLDD